MMKATPRSRPSYTPHITGLSSLSEYSSNSTRADASGQALYGLDPTRLPGIGYAFDADTGDGYLRLTWTDPDGTPQWRQYDTAGNRADGQSVAGINDLARDFFLHAADAVLPAWEAETNFARGGGDATAPAGLFTGAVSADGAGIARTVLSLGAGATATTLLDLDGDGYLESTQWTASPLLAIDLNGDGLVSAFELVDGRADGDARNSLARLDANGDGRLDAGDPAFAALALWTDINGNGLVDDGEAASLTEAGIASLGYAGDTVTVDRTDGGGDTLNRATLGGDTLGVAHWLNDDGLYEAVEGGDTTLFALNRHRFDGDPAHVHGGEANPDAHGEEVFDVGDRRIQSTGNATLASTNVQTHVQGDPALRDAGAGRTLTGQAAGRFLGDEADLTVVSDPPAIEAGEPGASGETAPANAGRVPLVIGVGDPRVISDARPAGPPSPPRTSQPIAPFGAGIHFGADLGSTGISRFRSIHKHIRRVTAIQATS